MIIILSILFACTSTPDEIPSTPELIPSTPEADAQKPHQNIQPIQTHGVEQNLDQGQKHPPLPADNPIWEWDAKAFVPDFGWFGEHNWDGVRMRVMGHLAIGYRELARSYLENEEWDKGLQELEELEQFLESLALKDAAFAQEIQKSLLKATQRDIFLVQGLRDNTPLPKTLGLAELRRRYYELARVKNPDIVKIKSLQKELEPYLNLREDLDIKSFKDFTDRHKLRSRLFEAYSDVLDPLSNSAARWGYWRAEECPRQALALGLALEQLGGNSWHEKTADWNYTSPSLEGSSPIFYPSMISKNLKDSNLELVDTSAEFGRLPTGDSLIDIGGQPGPFGIGSLMKLDHKDIEHAAWLQKKATLIVGSLPENPAQAKEYCQKAMQELDSYTHGSRFYNVKQMRNACTRQLARAGHFSEAQEIFQTGFPLHNQDWACPNREGLLLTISGRLYLQDQQKIQGQKILQKAIDSGLKFLEQVSKAEKGELKEPRPPRINIGKQIGPNGKQNGKQSIGPNGKPIGDPNGGPSNNKNHNPANSLNPSQKMGPI